MIDNSVEYSNGCNIKIKPPEPVSSIGITLVEYPISETIDFYYNHVEANKKRKFKLNDCTYLMPSFSFSDKHIQTLDIGKINNHYVYIHIIRNHI